MNYIFVGLICTKCSVKIKGGDLRDTRTPLCPTCIYPSDDAKVNQMRPAVDLNQELEEARYPLAPIKSMQY